MTELLGPDVALEQVLDRVPAPRAVDLGLADELELEIIDGLGCR